MSDVKKKVDDDWKRKAEEERDKLAKEPLPAPEAELPTPTFESLIASFGIQAAMALGEIKSPLSKVTSVDLDGARYVIDTLAMLGEKTKGNLDIREELAVKNLLTELRFKYVQVAQRNPQEGS
jgi:hypothetical protein